MRTVRVGACRTHARASEDPQLLARAKAERARLAHRDATVELVPDLAEVAQHERVEHVAVHLAACQGAPFRERRIAWA